MGQTTSSLASNQPTADRPTEQQVRELLRDVHPDLAADVLEFLAPEWDADEVSVLGQDRVRMRFGKLTVDYVHVPGTDLALANAFSARPTPETQAEAA